jgi:PelA/Pel-15E family pectate lyase
MKGVSALLAAVLLFASAASAADAPLKWGAGLLRRDADWYVSPAARTAAEAVLSYQSSQGAWPKNADLLTPATAETLAALEKKGDANTIDNFATTRPMRFLALVAQAAGGEGAENEKFRASVLRGVDYLLAAQYANGGFPQFYPLRDRGYYSRITYNDGAMIAALEVLRDVAAGIEPFAFVDPDRRARCADAVARGIDCILKTQIRQDGNPAAWCAQHDETTLAPAWARKFEPPSLSGSESVGVVRFLMTIDNPSPEVRASVEGAVVWLQKVMIRGQRLELIKGADGRMERRLSDDPAAPPLWARFYELGTDRPLYMDRDARPAYSYAELDYERRSGYDYHGEWAASLISNEYPAWREKHGLR